MLSTPERTDSPVEVPIFDKHRGRYPQTVAAFSHMAGGERALQAVADLEQRWMGLNCDVQIARPFRYVPTSLHLPECLPERHFDVVIAGGSLGLIAGVALANRGLKVMVFDKGRVGSAHREWNISERELHSLAKWGLFTEDELAATVATQYRRGMISFDATGTGVEACPLYMDGVLDVALDAQAVLDLARTRFVRAGGAIVEGRSFRRLHMAEEGRVSSVFELDGPDGVEYYATRLAIDTMGSASPIAVGLNNGLPFDGVCPTAGTIVEGLDVDRSTGDVLVSVAGTQKGRQLIWEGFPGRDEETTVYVFYYDKTGPAQAPTQGLLALFEQYFTLLPSYRPAPANWQHIKPVYGYIPARHGRTGRTAARGLLCMGDSAAGQSPLTFCGFGSFVRHVGRISALISYALRYDLLEERHLHDISPHQANLRVAWVFSRLMQPWSDHDPQGVNRLMNVFCAALRDVGVAATVRFLQDRYTFREYMRIMLTTARRYPPVFPLTARVLGLRGLLKWAGDILSFAGNDLLRVAFSAVGQKRTGRLAKAAGKLSPAIGLKLAAWRTGWHATE